MNAARGARPPLSLPGLCLLLLLLLAACGGGTTASGPAYPPLTGRIVDNADLLPPADEAALTQRLEALQRATSRQLVIATVPEMGGYEIEEYANGLFRHWQLGQRTANNGVLLLVARTERKIRVETGYGVEAIVTDALAGRIIREQIAPRFREDDYAGGIRAGADALLSQLQAPPEAAEQAAVAAEQAQGSQRRERRGGSGSPIALFFWLGVLGFVVVGMIGSGFRGRRYRKRRGPWGAGPVVIWGDNDWGRRDRGWGGGSSWGGWGGGGGGGSWGGGGGGGFSGGGGSSGGGGASGGW